MSPNKNPDVSKQSQSLNAPKEENPGLIDKTKQLVGNLLEETGETLKLSEKVPEGMAMIIRSKNPNDPSLCVYESFPAGTSIPEDKETCLVPESISFQWRKNKFNYNERITFSTSNTKITRLLGIIMENSDETTRASELCEGTIGTYCFHRDRGVRYTDENGNSKNSFDSFYILQHTMFGVTKVENIDTGEIYTEVDHSRGVK